MKSLLLLIFILWLSASVFAQNHKANLYIQNIKHYEVVDDVHFIEKRTPLSIELRRELIKIFSTSLGEKIINVNGKGALEFILVNDPRDAFGVTGNKIYYMKSPLSWYLYKRDSGHLPSGAYMAEATLGTLIAHEIGHTPIGRAALGLPEINTYLRTTFSKGRVGFVFSREKVKQEELRAVRLFENPYRKHFDIPLRESYYHPGDVFSPEID